MYKPKNIFEDFDNNHDYSNLTYQFCTECVIEGKSINKNEANSNEDDSKDSSLSEEHSRKGISRKNYIISME